MGWVELLIEEPANKALKVPGSRWKVDDLPGIGSLILDPAIHDAEERDDGKTVFFSCDAGRGYLTPDQATAMGMALIKAAAQERNR